MEQIEKLTEIKQLEGALEAILFAAGHPVKYEKIGEVLSLTPRDTKRMAEHLASSYNSSKHCLAVRLIADIFSFAFNFAKWAISAASS